MNFLLIVTGYNCSDNVLPCYFSIAIQNENWKAVFIDDASTDDTYSKICKIKDPRVIKENFTDNVGAAYRRFKAIKKYGNPDDVVVLIGMDDLLIDGSLTRIRKEYEKGKLMTYGMYQYKDGTIPSFELEFDNKTHEQRSYRKETYRSTAPNTFKCFLFELFKEDDFIVNGEWIKATTESPLMFGLLEMCGQDRIGIIGDPIYIYRKHFTDNARERFGRDYQDNIYNTIINRPQKDLI